MPNEKRSEPGERLRNPTEPSLRDGRMRMRDRSRQRAGWRRSLVRGRPTPNEERNEPGERLRNPTEPSLRDGRVRMRDRSRQRAGWKRFRPRAGGMEAVPGPRATVPTRHGSDGSSRWRGPSRAKRSLVGGRPTPNEERNEPGERLGNPTEPSLRDGRMRMRDRSRQRAGWKRFRPRAGWRRSLVGGRDGSGPWSAGDRAGTARL